MAAEYHIVACHGDHAGKAHLSIKHGASGTEIAIQHVPFANKPGEILEQEQARIFAEAARIARDVAAFLEAECGQPNRRWPTKAHRCGPSPNDDEPLSAFGQVLRTPQG